jgi:hypothetical protein
MPDAKRTRARQTVPTDVGPIDLPLLNISAPLDYAIIPATFQNLICGKGKVGDRVVLTPYVSFRMDRSLNVAAQSVEDLETVEAFSGSLSYENMAFLIMDLSRDFRNVVNGMAVFSAGTLKSEPVRLNYSAHCLARARDALNAAILELETLAAQSKDAEGEAGAEPTPKPARRKPKGTSA